FYNVYEQNPIQEGKLLFVPVRAAFNHRDHLLASVLIINGVEDWKLEDRLLYYVEGEIIAEGRFTHELLVPSHSAVPWTFMFHPNSFRRPPSLHNWKVSFSSYEK
ncbi:MAG: SLAP domain-containing protein, partial [Anaerobacillus sp.]